MKLVTRGESEDKMSDANLQAVLSALKNSKKLQHWDKPPRDFGPDNPEDSAYNRNGLKDIGNLSNLSFSNEFSFGNDEKKPKDDDHDENDEESKSDGTCTSPTPETVRLEETLEVFEPGFGDALYIARRAKEQYQLALKLQEMAIENECRREAKERAKVRCDAYISQLQKIRKQSEKEWTSLILNRDEKLAHEEDQLRKKHQETEQAVTQCKNEYSQYIAQKSSELVDACERAQRQEAEEANMRRLHLNNLQNNYTKFVSHVSQMRELYKEVDGGESLDTETETFLNQTVTQVEDLLNSSQTSTTTQEQFDNAQANLQQGFISITEITQALNVKKEEKAKLEQEKAAQEASRAKALQQQQQQQQQQIVQSEEIEEQTQEAARTCVEPPSDNQARFIELKEKVQHFLNAKDALARGRETKLRQLAKAANQLSVTDQFINRDRLQQILSILDGREVERGKGSISNPSEALYVKNFMASKIVKLGTSQDQATTAVYSWLLVNLSLAHPDMVSLFLYYLYSECLGLVPVLPDRSQPCTIDYLHQELGRRDQEGEEVFSKRNESCAYMYGLVLALFSKRKGAPEQGPVRGWELLAKLISSPPIPCATCEIILYFLKAFGYTLQETYGKQFLKLMVYLSKVYLPQLEQMKGHAGAQSFIMLQTLVRDFESRKKLHQDPVLEKYKN